MPDNNSRFSWLNLTANGNVRPSRVVVGVTGNGNALKAVEASTAGTVPPLGLAREHTRFPPGDPADDGFIAIANEPLSILGPGDIGDAIAGAAITKPDQPLTFDTQGRVVTIAASGGGQVWCIGWPMETPANAGEKVKIVIVQPFQVTIAP